MTTTSTQPTRSTIRRPLRYWYLSILALSGFVTSFGAHIVATNLNPDNQTGAFTLTVREEK